MGRDKTNNKIILNWISWSESNCKVFGTESDTQRKLLNFSKTRKMIPSVLNIISRDESKGTVEET